MGSPSFEELLAEGESVPVQGWDFSWFAGRATEERPSWRYARLLTGRLAGARAALDVQTGGGEVLAEALARAPEPPAVLAATESWPPNAELARRRLRRSGVAVIQAADGEGLPFSACSFDPGGQPAPHRSGVERDRPSSGARRDLLLAAGSEPARSGS